MVKETRIVFVGLAGVGKSSLFERLYHDRYTEEQMSTLGAIFSKMFANHNAITRHYDVDTCRSVLHIWDTAGQERYAGLVPMYYNGAQIVIVVHDGSATSLEYAQIMIDRILAGAHGEAPQILIWQNKVDINGRSDHAFAGVTVPTVHVSAKTGENVAAAFFKAVADYLDTHVDPLLASPAIVLDKGRSAPWQTWLTCGIF